MCTRRRRFSRDDVRRRSKPNRPTSRELDEEVEGGDEEGDHADGSDGDVHLRLGLEREPALAARGAPPSRPTARGSRRRCIRSPGTPRACRLLRELGVGLLALSAWRGGGEVGEGGWVGVRTDAARDGARREGGGAAAGARRARRATGPRARFSSRTRAGNGPRGDRSIARQTRWPRGPSFAVGAPWRRCRPSSCRPRARRTS